MGIELTAIILAAGKGSRITELCTSLPKCLLPIANEPVIYYPLRMLQKAGFKNVIIVVPDSYEDLIQKSLANRFQLQLDYFTIPFQEDVGTAESLRQIAEKRKIENDVIVISCDVIIDFDLLQLINFYRLYDPTFTAVISTTQLKTESSVPGKKGKAKLERDLIAVETTGSHRLLFLNAEADFEDEVTLHKAILRKCPEFEMRTDYLDSHIYILKKWVIKYLVENRSVSSLKGELVPILIKKQFMKSPNYTKEAVQNVGESSVLSAHQSAITDYFECDEIKKTVQQMQPGYKKMDPIQPNLDCLAYLVKDAFCVRSNNIVAYAEANKQLPRTFIDEVTTPTSPSGTKKQVGSDCLVGRGTTIGDKTSVKRTVIGNNCTIGEKVKLANCVVMDNVNIEESCSIQGSIICSDAHIGRSSEIKDCVISARQLVHPLSKLANEVVMDLEHMMQL